MLFGGKSCMEYIERVELLSTDPRPGSRNCKNSFAVSNSFTTIAVTAIYAMTARAKRLHSVMQYTAY